MPKGISGFAFNTRRAIFADPRAREGLATMFDFEWINANLYAGVYERSKSFFDDSELSAAGRPASDKERALLAPFPGAVRDDIMEGRWAPPVSDGSGRDRALARQALDLLGQAGYRLSDGALKDARGAPLSFEILVKNRQEERLALAYSRSLARIGVGASVRLVDEVQFQRRRARFDFDMMIGSWIASPSPGNEQRNRWSTAAATMEGSYNICGAASPAIDAMIAAVVAARGQRRFRRGGARARPAAAVGLLYCAAVLRARPMGRLFLGAGPSRPNAAVWRLARNLVAQAAVNGALGGAIAVSGALGGAIRRSHALGRNAP